MADQVAMRRDGHAETALALRRDGDAETALVSLGGELDLASAPRLERELRDLAATKPGRVVVDLRELSFMDCIGLAVLVRAQSVADANGYQLALAHVPAQVRRLMELTQLTDRFTIEDW